MGIVEKLNGYDLTNNTKLPEINLVYVPLVGKLMVSFIVFRELGSTYLLSQLDQIWTTFITNILALFFIRKVVMSEIFTYIIPIQGDDESYIARSKLSRIFSNESSHNLSEETIMRVRQFSKDVLDKFRSNGVTILVITVVLFTIAPPFLQGAVSPQTHNLFGDIPISPTKNMLYLLVFEVMSIQAFTLFLFLIWTGIFFLIFTLSLKNIERFTDHKEIGRFLVDKSVDIEPFTKHSLRSFRRSTKVIADTYLKFTVAAILALFLLDFTVVAINSSFLDNEIGAIAFLIGNILVIIGAIIGFLTPQLNSKQIMDEIKDDLLMRCRAPEMKIERVQAYVNHWILIRNNLVEKSEN